MSDATRLLMIRHGQSEWNASGRWQGHADTALSETGRRQAGHASEVLGTFDSVWASDLERAHETAHIIAELLGIGPVQTDPRLRENDVGPWQGLTTTEVEAGWPGFLDSRRRPPGFEDPALAVARVLAAMGEIASANAGGEVLIVSHGGVIAAVHQALGVPDHRVGNLGGSWFTVHGDGRVTAGEAVNLLPIANVTTADVL